MNSTLLQGHNSFDQELCHQKQCVASEMMCYPLNHGKILFIQIAFKDCAHIDVCTQASRQQVQPAELAVQENGKGLGQRNAMQSARFGLMGMRERVQAMHRGFPSADRGG